MSVAIEAQALTTPTLKRHLLETTLVSIVLTGVSYAVALILGWATTLNWLEVAAVFTSYACTYLCVKQRRINYPIGALSTLLYCILFFQQGLIASAVLNAYLTPALVYGWLRWRNDKVGRPVKHISPKTIPLYLGGGIVAWFIGYLIVNALGGHQAIFDVIILVGTIIAQLLLDNKRLENWWVWAVVNVIAIGVYFTQGLPLAGLQYLFFLGNAFWGWVQWKRSMSSYPSLPGDHK